MRVLLTVPSDKLSYLFFIVQLLHLLPALYGLIYMEILSVLANSVLTYVNKKIGKEALETLSFSQLLYFSTCINTTCLTGIDVQLGTVNEVEAQPLYFHASFTICHV